MISTGSVERFLPGKVILVDTNEYYTGSGGLAEQMGCIQLAYGNGVRYRLPPENGDSWLIDIRPAAGLFFTDAYFTLLKPVVREYRLKQPGLWLWSLASGVVILTEQGGKARRLTPGINLIVNRGIAFEIAYESAAPIRWTSMLLFEDCLVRYFQDNFAEQPFSLAAAKRWKPFLYNTPDLVMVFEQLKYAVRTAFDNSLPMAYYQCKMGEILAFILRNRQNEGYWKDYVEKRRDPKHMTYQNRKYIWKAKAELDKNILNPPSLEQLAIIAGMSESRLRRYFQYWYGVSIAEYVRREKLKHALRLLWHDDLSIGNIAALVGYESASKFSLAFKKIYQVTPREVRRSFQI